MKVLIIYNPAAGKRRKIAKSARKVLAEVDCDWAETDKKGKYLANLNGNDYERVIVIGGDGTVHEIANWILINNYNLILGIVPCGSANLLANCFKIPKNIGLAVKMALSNNYQKIDVGLINKERYFLIAAGLGYDAWVIKNTRRAWKQLFGFWAYTIAMWQGLLHLKETNFSLTVDGERHQHHAKTIFIMNFGKFLGFDFGPDVSYQDGYLSLAVVRPVKVIDYFKMFARIVGKKYFWKKRLEYYKFKRLQINYNKKVWSQVDGEIWKAGSPVEIEVVEKKLKIVSK